MADSERTTFWDLPPEIRFKIYSILLSEPSVEMLRANLQYPREFRVRRHRYPTLRESRVLTLPDVWKDAIPCSPKPLKDSAVHTLRAPPEIQGARAAEQKVNIDFEWIYVNRETRINFLFASKRLYLDAMKEYHRRVDLICEAPEHLYDLSFRLHDCGTAYFMTSLLLDLQLFEESYRGPEYALHNVPNFAGWEELIKSLRSDGIGKALPGLRNLRLRFIEAEDGCIDQLFPEPFDRFLRDTFAPKFDGLRDINVRVGGLRSRGVERWIKHGMQHGWDMAVSFEDLSQLTNKKASGDFSFWC